MLRKSSSTPWGHVCSALFIFILKEKLCFFFPVQETQQEKQAEMPQRLLQMFIDIAAALSKVHPV